MADQADDTGDEGTQDRMPFFCTCDVRVASARSKDNKLTAKKQR
jgi:hypothetical protein